MKFIKRNWQRFVIVFYSIILPFSRIYADGETCDEGKICNPLASKDIDSIPKFIEILLEGALKIGIPIVALAIIYSGFLFVSAMGNTEKLNKAKATLLYTLIGAAILLGSLAIAKLISDTIIGLGP